MKFILVRHGETKANVKKIFSGWSNYELTKKGKLQIKLLAEELKDYEVDYIYASPLGRAVETAKEIGESIGKKIIIDDNLREMNFGIFDGRTAKEAEEIYPKEWENWINNYESVEIPDGESLQSTIKRVKIFIDPIKNQEGSCIIVSHNGIILSILTYLLDLQAKQMWHFQCTTGGYIEIDYTNKFAYLRKLIPSKI